MSVVDAAEGACIFCTQHNTECTVGSHRLCWATQLMRRGGGAYTVHHHAPCIRPAPGASSHSDVCAHLMHTSPGSDGQDSCVGFSRAVLCTIPRLPILWFGMCVVPTEVHAYHCIVLCVPCGSQHAFFLLAQHRTLGAPYMPLPYHFGAQQRSSGTFLLTAMEVAQTKWRSGRVPASVTAAFDAGHDRKVVRMCF
jgi:hypothetical protein